MRITLTDAEAKGLAQLLSLASNEFFRRDIPLDHNSFFSLAPDDVVELTATMEKFMAAVNVTFEPPGDWSYLFSYFEQKVVVALKEASVERAEQAILDALASAEQRDLAYYSFARDGWKRDMVEGETMRREALTAKT